MDRQTVASLRDTLIKQQALKSLEVELRLGPLSDRKYQKALRNAVKRVTGEENHWMLT